MAFLSLESENEQFSFALRKNPEAGMLIKTNRKGFLFGWYTSSERYAKENQRFNVFFQDSSTELSYGKSDRADGRRTFEHLDTHRYQSPRFIFDAIDSYFNHLTGDRSGARTIEEDVVAKQTLTITFLQVDREGYLERFQRSFGDPSRKTPFDIQWTAHRAFEGATPSGYTVTISGTCLLGEILDLAQLLGLFLLIANRDAFIFTDNHLIRKYLGVLLKLKVPYYIASLFKTHLLSRSKTFKAFKEELEATAVEEVTLERGNSHDARIRAITKALSFSGHIVDVGCGEGRYFHLSKNLRDEASYYAIDIDQNVLAKAANYAARKEYDVLIQDNLGELLRELTVDHHLTADTDVPKDSTGQTFSAEVIMTEVLEHMPISEAIKLLGRVMAQPFVERIVITVPNRAFNDAWFFDEGQMRHDDHDWEPTHEEMISFIARANQESYAQSNLLSTPDRFNLESSGCGDVVNGEPLSLMYVLNRISQHTPVEATAETAISV